MPNKTLLYLVGAIYLLASCKKNSPEIPVYHICPEVLTYVNLALNGYYIYKDSATGGLDSVVVTESSLTTEFSPATSGSYLSPGSPAFYYESYNLLMKNVSGSVEQEWFKGAVIMGGCELRDLSDNSEFGYAFKYPISQFPGTSTFSEYAIPILTIEGKTYTDVAVFMKATDPDPTKDYYRKTTYYWVKGIGIIKKEIISRTSVKTSLLVRKG